MELQVLPFARSPAVKGVSLGKGCPYILPSSQQHLEPSARRRHAVCSPPAPAHGALWPCAPWGAGRGVPAAPALGPLLTIDHQLGPPGRGARLVGGLALVVSAIAGRDRGQEQRAFVQHCQARPATQGLRGSTLPPRDLRLGRPWPGTQSHQREHPSPSSSTPHTAPCGHVADPPAQCCLSVSRCPGGHRRRAPFCFLLP